MTEQQQQKLQVCENNWVRRITRTKKVDRRTMNDLWKQVRMQCSLTGSLKQSSKESRDGKNIKDAGKGEATAEMGGLHEEGHG